MIYNDYLKGLKSKGYEKENDEEVSNMSEEFKKAEKELLNDVPADEAVMEEESEIARKIMLMSTNVYGFKSVGYSSL